MSPTTHNDIEKLEPDLWEAADNLRANSKLTSSEYFMPVLGVIFLRHAANRFDAATSRSSATRPPARCRSVPWSRPTSSTGALLLPEAAHYDEILALPQRERLAEADDRAMKAIEAEFEPLRGSCPRTTSSFEPDRARRPAAHLRPRGAAHRRGRRLRPHLRILPDEVRHAGRAGQRRVLHAAVAGADHRQRHRAGSRHRLRPRLRLGRHVRAVQPLHRGRGARTPATRSPSTVRRRPPPPSGSPR